MVTALVIIFLLQVAERHALERYEFTLEVDSQCDSVLENALTTGEQQLNLLHYRSERQLQNDMLTTKICRWVGHPLGRRKCVLMGDAFVIVGGSLQASSWSVGQIIAARVLCGFGVGFVSCTVLTYMSEMSIKKTERGREAGKQTIWLIGGVALGKLVASLGKVV